MREYPKLIERLIREYTARAYEAELGQALGELETPFSRWREISAFEPSDHIHAFHQDPARELWSRDNARINDTLIAHAREGRMWHIQMFRYLDDLDCFVVSDEYRRIADHLGLTEWSPVVWIGRLFTLDSLARARTLFHSRKRPSLGGTFPGRRLQRRFS